MCTLRFRDVFIPHDTLLRLDGKKRSEEKTWFNLWKEGNLWKLMNLFFKHLERDLHFLLHGVCWFANEPALLNRIASYFQHANIEQVATVGNEQHYLGQIIMICRKQSRIDYTKALKKKIKSQKKSNLSFCLSNFWL